MRVRLPELTTFRDVRVVLGDADRSEKVALVACHCAFEREIGVSLLEQRSRSGTRIVCDRWLLRQEDGYVQFDPSIQSYPIPPAPTP